MTDASLGMASPAEPTGEYPSAQQSPPRPWGELAFAIVLCALGLFALVGVFGIRVPVGAQVGPTVFPLVVSITLLASSAVVIVSILRGRLGTPDDGEDIDPSIPTDWLTLAKIVGLVVAHIVLVPLIGWAPAAALLFGGIAWSLGAKRWWMAFTVGAILALTVQIIFGGLLGLSLSWGPALSWLGGVF